MRRLRLPLIEWLICFAVMSAALQFCALALLPGLIGDLCGTSAGLHKLVAQAIMLTAMACGAVAAHWLTGSRFSSLHLLELAGGFAGMQVLPLPAQLSAMLLTSEVSGLWLAAAMMPGMIAGHLLVAVLARLPSHFLTPRHFMKVISP